MSEEITVVKIPDTDRMIIVEFENKGIVSGLPISFFEAFTKYMNNEMEFVTPYPSKTSE